MSKDLIQSYEEVNEEERLNSSLARRVEFLSTVDTISKFLFDGVKIFDCGCGVGVYSIWLAEHGANVVSIDIVSKHIERLREIISEKHLPIKAEIGDAVNLSHFPDESFDITLCMGPLYHLTSDEQHIRCINECVRVTKPNGILAFSYISPYSVFPCVIRGDINRISYDLVDGITTRKVINASDECCFWTDNYYYDPDDIENRLQSLGVSVIDHLATDGQSIAFQSVINSMDDKQFQTWMYYHKLTCRVRSILGASNHGLVIGKKKVT